MSRFRGRSGGRAKRGYFWSGQQGLVTITNTVTFIEAYNPSISSLGDTKDLRHEKTVLWLSCISTTSALTRISFALEHLQTDLSLAEQNVLDPSSTDLDFFNKRQVMWGGSILAPAAGQTPMAIYEMVESKRRIDAAQESVGLTIVGSASGVTTSYWIRSLYSKRA